MHVVLNCFLTATALDLLLQLKGSETSPPHPGAVAVQTDQASLLVTVTVGPVRHD